MTKEKEDNYRVLVLVDKEPERATEEEIKEILMNNDGTLERWEDFKDQKIVKGYLCKLADYFRYWLMDMDEVLLFVDEDNYVYSYEHSGNYSPFKKDNMVVVGLMDENAEIEAIDTVYVSEDKKQ